MVPPPREASERERERRDLGVPFAPSVPPGARRAPRFRDRHRNGGVCVCAHIMHGRGRMTIDRRRMFRHRI